MEEKLNSVESVKIDDGTFKYILVKVYDPDNEDSVFKYIVRGDASAGYHGDIYEVTTPDIEKLGLECECVGGGRIKHDPAAKTIHVYGYSQGYGRADHLQTCRLLKEKYPDYAKIDFSNDGY
ncbi:14 kDa phosphohistidine phosphatase-like [Argiope bruennichi]|uniref:Sex-regulated protein janus-B n=1 Tax=Argiope bruennichi TaxID=94029 RepID=A0A8T0F8Z0_ARGBR|nr:14 kDa phosphohistidine phosphatase-like [Argiope bruennichi]KAF8787341.1 Sex-regulated protein janus-A like protein [Argiope bruennichi]